MLAPIVSAGIALARRQPAQAIEQLYIVAPYELGFIAALAPIYLRAQSYLMLGLGQQAAEQFQRILDYRGSDPFSPFYPAASVGAARALALTSGNWTRVFMFMIDSWRNGRLLIQTFHYYVRRMKNAKAFDSTNGPFAVRLTLPKIQQGFHNSQLYVRVVSLRGLFMFKRLSLSGLAILIAWTVFDVLLRRLLLRAMYERTPVCGDHMIS